MPCKQFMATRIVLAPLLITFQLPNPIYAGTVILSECVQPLDQSMISKVESASAECAGCGISAEASDATLRPCSGCR